MTPTELKQAADEMVANWMILLVQSLPFISYASIDTPILVATHFAIAHCKRVINEITWWHDTTSYETTMDFEGAERRINHYRLILSELEGRVK